MQKISTLVSLSEFVTKAQEAYLNGFITLTDFNAYVTRYNMFLQQPLELGFFVPCDASGNIYEDYKTYSPLHKGRVSVPYEGFFEVSKKRKGVDLLNGITIHPDDQRYYNKDKYEKAKVLYSNAKDRVVFGGFCVAKNFEGKYVLKTFTSNQVWAYLDCKRFSLNYHFKSNKIEDLADFKLPISESAINQIY